MPPTLYHLQLNVTNLPFYTDLFACFEYREIDRWDSGFGVTNGTVDFWIFQTPAEYAHIPYHRKATGLNHLAFRVESPAEVDRFTREFLTPRHIAPLYESPKPMPEYAPDYYAVYFEDPDRMKIEVMCRSRDVPNLAD
jgi:catechol 2,3-dioxygenase-like lactoylglutathione lyase family enzyme